MIVIQIDQASVARVRATLAHIKNGAERAMTRALNRTAEHAQTRANQEIRKDVALTATYIREHIKITRATFGSLQSRITATRRGVLMTRYAYTVLQRGGVSVRIKPAGARKTLPGAFLIPRLLYSNVPGIAIPKKGRPTSGPGSKAIDVLHSPSISQVLTEVKDEIAPEMADYLLAQMDRETLGLLQSAP